MADEKEKLNSVIGTRMNWAFIEKKDNPSSVSSSFPSISQSQSNVAVASQHQNLLAKFNELFRLWGMEELYGASDTYLTAQATQYFAGLMKSLILEDEQNSSLQPCPICLEEHVGEDLRYLTNLSLFTQNPNYHVTTKVLACGHLVCWECSNNITDDECPVCQYKPVQKYPLESILRLPGTQANIIARLDLQLEVFSPVAAFTNETVQWNWFAGSSFYAIETAWADPNLPANFRPFDAALSSQVQAAAEIGSAVVLMTHVNQKPCFYYVDPFRKFQVKLKMDFSRQRRLGKPNGRWVAWASKNDKFEYDEERQVAIQKACEKKISLLPINVPDFLLFENSPEAWRNLYSKEMDENAGGYCLHLGIMRQVRFTFERSADRLFLMRMVKPGTPQ